VKRWQIRPGWPGLGRWPWHHMALSTSKRWAILGASQELSRIQSEQKSVFVFLVRFEIIEICSSLWNSLQSDQTMQHTQLWSMRTGLLLTVVSTLTTQKHNCVLTTWRFVHMIGLGQHWFHSSSVIWNNATTIH
jgi:hypothetical protein